MVTRRLRSGPYGSEVTTGQTTLPVAPLRVGSGWSPATALGAIVVVVAAVVGGDVAGLRTRLWGSATPDARPAASGRDAAVPAGAATAVPVPAPPTVLRSQPWWQGMRTVEGSGPAAPAPFTIDSGAVQWRVRWTCETGRLRVTAPNQPRAVVDAACPGSGTGFGARTGAVNLQVAADGPWRLQVDQQLDVPLVEPPLPAMSAAGTAKVASDDVYRVDQTGQGRVTLYRLADGGYALRLDDFYVTPNIDLEIRMSTLAEPRSTADIAGAPSVHVAPLDITAGSMNLLVPNDVDPTRYRSIVIWCEVLFSAYAAVALTPAA